MEETKTKQISLPVAGMHCPSCALNIERSVAHLPGIIKAVVNFANSQLVVQYDPLRVDVKQIVKAVEKPGYQIRESFWERTQTLWAERKPFIQVVITGLLVIGAWAFINTNDSLSIILAVIAVIIGGYPIYTSAVRVLLIPDLNVEVLITVASLAAIAVGAYREAAMVILIMLMGEMLEKTAVRKTSQAITKLIQLSPTTALVKRGDIQTEVPAESVQINDIVIIKPGERIPVDGEVATGESAVNESMLTGESLPRTLTVGSKVYAGTLNESGSFEIKATQVGDGTQLSHIKQLVIRAELEKAPIQKLANRFARYFIPVVVLISLTVYLITKNISKSITVLVASCPCAMVLAAPTAVVAGLGNAARKGILIKGGQYLETFGHLKTLLLDKTGTLTQGKLTVTEVKPLNHYSPEGLIRLTAIAEKRSEHPIARAVLEYTRQKGITIPDPDFFEVLKGKGVVARGPEEIIVGNRLLMKEKGITINSEEEKLIEALEQTGKTVLLVAVKNQLAGLISVSDSLRPDIARIIEDIRKSGVKRIALLTGDNARTAQYIARESGIEEWYSNLLPEDKINKLKEIKQTGGKTGMIGDGINDAPALAAADVGIAMGVIGSDVAIESADVSLMKDDLSMVPVAMRLSRRVWNTIIQNFVFSICYNIIMLTVVGLVVHDHSGITWGAILHQLSCFIVVANSLRLLRG